MEWFLYVWHLIITDWILDVMEHFLASKETEVQMIK